LQAKALIAQLNPEKPRVLGGSDSGNLQGQEGDAAKFENLWLVVARLYEIWGLSWSINGVVYPKSPIDTVYYSHYSRDESYGKTMINDDFWVGYSHRTVATWAMMGFDGVARPRWWSHRFCHCSQQSSYGTCYRTAPWLVAVRLHRIYRWM